MSIFSYSKKAHRAETAVSWAGLVGHLQHLHLYRSCAREGAVEKSKSFLPSTFDNSFQTLKRRAQGVQLQIFNKRAASRLHILVQKLQQQASCHHIVRKIALVETIVDDFGVLVIVVVVDIELSCKVLPRLRGARRCQLSSPYNTVSQLDLNNVVKRYLLMVSYYILRSPKLLQLALDMK